MKILFDFLPILLFFIAYKSYDIYVATQVAIAASFLQLTISWVRHKKVEKTYLITFILILVLGGATLYLQDEQFIKWKPTLVNALFGLAFLISQFFGKLTLLERMMGSSIELPRQIWRKLNLTWVLFFFMLAAANTLVMYNFDTDTWVNFKLFGMFGLTLVFMVLQGLFIAKHLPDQEIEE